MRFVYSQNNCRSQIIMNSNPSEVHHLRVSLNAATNANTRDRKTEKNSSLPCRALHELRGWLTMCVRQWINIEMHAIQSSIAFYFDHFARSHCIAYSLCSNKRQWRRSLTTTPTTRNVRNNNQHNICTALVALKFPRLTLIHIIVMAKKGKKKWKFTFLHSTFFLSYFQMVIVGFHFSSLFSFCGSFHCAFTRRQLLFFWDSITL